MVPIQTRIKTKPFHFFHSCLYHLIQNLAYLVHILNTNCSKRIIFKNTSCIFLRARSIIGNDWTKISFNFFEGYAIPIPTPGGGATATMFSTQFNNIVTGMRDLLASTQLDKLVVTRVSAISIASC